MSEQGSKELRDKFGKLTIKEPYAKTKFLSVHIRGYIDLVRPFTLFAPFVVSMSIIAASMIYNKIPIQGDWWVTVGQASFTVAIVNAASNALNQATDFEADMISKPYRPIPKGIVKPDEAQSLAYLLYLFALLRSVTINLWFGVFIFLIMIFTVTYSLPPRIKRFMFLNQIWIAIPRGFFGILASWSVFIPEGQTPFTATSLIIGTIATLFLVGGMATKDITDAVADKRTGTRTLINTYGTKKTAFISLPFMFFPFTSIPILINIGVLDQYLWPLTFLLIPSVIISYLMIKESESKSLENVHAWSMMYIVYISFAMGFALLVIFSEFVQIPKILF